MKGKITLLVGGAVGYVLGTAAGRERYEQIKSQAQGIWNNPKVQEKASQAQDLAKEKAPILKDKVAEKASSSPSTSSPSTISDPDVVVVDEVVEVDELPPYPASTTPGI
jgi:hypothetical protein